MQPLRKAAVWRFIKILKKELPYDPAIPFLGIQWKKIKTLAQKKKKSGRERKTLREITYTESKKAKLVATETRIVVTRGWGWENWGGVGQSAYIYR